MSILTNATNANATTPLEPIQGGSGVSSPTAHGVLVAEGTSAFNPIVLAAGHILIGTTASDPASATLTAGTGISISSVTGSITISATGSGATVVNQNTSSATLAAFTTYICNNGASLITFTLPSSATIGDTYTIVGGSSGGWKIAQNAGQAINFGLSTTTSGTGGSLASSNRYDCVTLSCNTTNNDWTAYAAQGNLTVV
jgi:hypothetical protein